MQEPTRLQSVWTDWHIITKNSLKKGNPDAVEHSALIYGITGNGELKTVYPANFKPQQTSRSSRPSRGLMSRRWLRFLSRSRRSRGS